MNDTEFTKYKYKNDHHIFIAKGPFLVMAIRRGFNFLWHPTKNRYPNVVVIYPKEKQTRKLRLFYPGQRTGFTDPEDEPKPEKPQQLRGFVEQKKQKKKYSVETIGVEKSQTTLKTKKVKHHVPEGLVESDPEPATDIEVELTDEPKPEEIPQVQPQQVPPPIAIVQPQQVPHPIAIAPPLEPLPPPPIPQFQVPIVPVPSLQVVQPQVLLFPPQPVQNILVHLNIKDKRNTDILRYIWDENDKADVFSLEYPYLFDMVLMGDELLWEPDGNYPYEFLLFLSNLFCIRFKYLNQHLYYPCNYLYYHNRKKCHNYNKQHHSLLNQCPRITNLWLNRLNRQPNQVHKQ
ncbi:hypothetical protein MACJ_000376 [Theileria orientalis]|uniref:Uncharacterized protein n=1 Tax=Theileria orientalis TaxID=68886 RepID=A0A976M3Y0_THEOR|nr:hypothetical protein MACJ_000376 [Theileria orientalis]